MVVYDSYDHGSGRAALDAVAGLGDRWWKLDSRIDLVSARVLALFGIICSSKRFFTKLTSDGCCSTSSGGSKSPMQMPYGAVGAREKATRRRSRISLVLANLFMDDAFEGWIVREYPMSIRTLG